MNLQVEKRAPSRKAAADQADGMRERILARATEYFAEHGFDGSTRDLAKSIGISQSLLYHYFSQKGELTTSVYNRLYASRWRPEWDAIFGDTTLSGREKIKRFYLSYYRTVLKRPWTRIFLLGAMKGLDIHRKNFDVVREKIFPLIIAELRGDSRPLILSELSDLEIELAWNLHSSIFYLAVRRWILRLKGRFGVEESIAFSVDVFLDGASNTLKAGARSA